MKARKSKILEAFIKRDIKVMFTYRSALFFNYTDMFLNLLLFYLVIKMFGIRTLESLMKYGGDVISFVIIGIMGWGYLWAVMGTLTRAIEMDMRGGTLESIFLTPISPFSVMLGYASWSFIVNSISIFSILLVSIFFFNIETDVNYAYGLLSLIFSVVMMFGIGLIVAGLNIYVKQVGAVVQVLQRITYFLCGVLFPITVLPDILQSTAKILPFYYSLAAFRLSLTANPTLEIMLPYLIILSALAVSSMICGITVLRKGLNKARKDGTLVFY